MNVVFSEKIHFDLQQQPEWQNFDLQHFEWQFFSGNALYNNALNGKIERQYFE